MAAQLQHTERVFYLAKSIERAFWMSSLDPRDGEAGDEERGVRDGQRLRQAAHVADVLRRVVVVDARVHRVDDRPDLRKDGGIVAAVVRLAAQDEERCAVDEQRMPAVLAHDLRQWSSGRRSGKASVTCTAPT